MAPGAKWLHASNPVFAAVNGLEHSDIEIVNIVLPV